MYIAIAGYELLYAYGIYTSAVNAITDVPLVTQL